MKIPITKELSTSVYDLLGVLDIPDSYADHLAKILAAGLTIKVCAVIGKYGDNHTLKLVSFNGSPVESSGPKQFFGVSLVSASGSIIRRVAGFSEWHHAADFGEKQVAEKKCSGFRIFNASEFVENSESSS